ncbi:hypothetical protein [Yoonia sp.]|uniref:hypothetical protein n=1 Tax=Yoonia sp. TaxID=2212373 RepID=UPI002FDA36B4
MRILISTALVGTLLAACSISGGSSGEPVPTTVSRNTPAVGWGCVGDFCGISYELGGANLANLPKNGNLDYGQFGGAGSSSGEMLFASETLDSTVALIRDDMEGTGVIYSRLDRTVLPLGEVYYSGDYVGLVTNTGNGNVVFIINGAAALDVDFAGGDVYGGISGRTVLGPTGDAAIGVTSDDVVFWGPINSQGLFSGVTSGGDINALSVTDAQAGTFDGLIAGLTGDEVVGGLDFVHSRTGDDYLETGAFFLQD